MTCHPEEPAAEVRDTTERESGAVDPQPEARTVTGLDMARSVVSFAYSRSSYCPAVDGILIEHEPDALAVEPAWVVQLLV